MLRKSVDCKDAGHTNPYIVNEPTESLEWLKFWKSDTQKLKSLENELQKVEDNLSKYNKRKEFYDNRRLSVAGKLHRLDESICVYICLCKYIYTYAYTCTHTHTHTHTYHGQQSRAK
jgi:hypothetical protein